MMMNPLIPFDAHDHVLDLDVVIRFLIFSSSKKTQPFPISNVPLKSK